MDVNSIRFQPLMSTQGGNVASVSSRMSSSSSSRKLEFVALLIPTIGVLALNQLVMVTSIVDATSESTGDLVGLQWYWTICQNDVALISTIAVGALFGVAVANTAIIAVGSFLVALSAVDVIHAMAIPTLAVKADAIPGRCALVRVSTEVSGSYSGQCSELCGSMHGFMPLNIVAVICCQDREQCRVWL